MLDVEKFIDGIHDYLGRAISPLAVRIKALEERPLPERGEKGADGNDGSDGKDGQSVDMDALYLEIANAAVKAVADIPAPKDGNNADPETIRDMVKVAVADMPRPENGKDGRHGKDGADGKDGKDADPELIKSAIAQNFTDMVSGLTRRFAEAAHG